MDEIQSGHWKEGGIRMIENNTSLLSGVTDAYSSCKTAKKENKTEEKNEAKKLDAGVVYEKTTEDTTSKKGTYNVNKMSAEDRKALVQQLKNEQVQREQQMVSLVQQMMTKQSATFRIADWTNGSDGGDAIWKFLASGEYTVDAATKEQAQKDIAEDGYYGVKQTSERLFDFASALAGDDADKMKKMQDAITKGYEQATKAWGKELPDICKETLEATNKLFDEYYASKAIAEA